jgi:hypothetical protein
MELNARKTAMESKPKGRKALVAGTGGEEDDGCGLWCREADYPKSLLSLVTGDDDRAAMTFDVYIVGEK